MADLDRPVLLEISSTFWLSAAPQAEGGGLWLCGPNGPLRRIEADRPAIGCLPLLERPYAVVKQECERVRAQHEGAVSAALDQLVPGGVVEAALAIGTDHWLRLALLWIAELGPSPRALWWVRAVEEHGATQDLRHGARRLRRTWAGVED